LRYNGVMTWWHRPRLWLALALAVVFIAAIAPWLRAPHVPQETSPLPTPAPPSTAALPSSWTGAGAILLWVTLGIVLALGITFLLLRWYRRTA